MRVSHWPVSELVWGRPTSGAFGAIQTLGWSPTLGCSGGGTAGPAARTEKLQGELLSRVQST